MCAGFVYRPHVETAEGVFTPDIVLDSLVVAAGNARFPVSVERLTGDAAIEVVGGETRGHGAVALIAASAGTLIGIGSDHLDGALADDPARARQVCAKPLSRATWRFAEIAGHLDAVRSDLSRDRGGRRRRPVARESETALADIAALPADGAVPGATVIFAHAGAEALPGPASVTVALEDRRLARRLVHRYAVRVL